MSSNKTLLAMARAETNKQLTMTEKTLIKNISIINEGQIFVADLIIESGIIQNTKKTICPPPDVIFYDRSTPLKNEYEALIEIRNTPKLKGIPIVIFSTTASDDAVNKKYELGADYYICKSSSFRF